ncbi:MAG: hypothetical protein ABIH28_01990 [archaeon]
MVEYSKDERKAMEMVDNYFRMIEGIGNFRVQPRDSQDLNEMVAFLEAAKGNSKIISDLHDWVWDYEFNRREAHTLLVKRNFLEKTLCTLVEGLQSD